MVENDYQVRLFGTLAKKKNRALTSQMFGFNAFYAPFLRSSVSYINKNSVKIVPFHITQFLIQLYVHVFVHVSCNVKFWRNYNNCNRIGFIIYIRK